MRSALFVDAPQDWVLPMLSALVLDALLIVILLMMVPLGFLRGGLREVCTAAGLLFGILLAEEWSGRWGEWLAGRLDVSTGAAEFIVAVFLVGLSVSLMGYGGTAAFSWRPGPGGRMYGAYIAMLNGLVLIGYLINVVVRTVYGGDTPDLIAEGFVSRALSSGFGWVLLAGAFGVIIATLFGMFVRERVTEPDALYPAAPGSTAPGWQQGTATPGVTSPPHVVADQSTESLPGAPVRIREVRHWEDVPEPVRTRQEYGGEWRQTWPEPKGQGPSLPWEQPPAPRPPTSKRGSGSLRRQEPETPKPTNSRDVLRNWMSDDSTGEKQ